MSTARFHEHRVLCVLPVRVLIIGCGYVGEALAARLLNAAHTVMCVRRNPPPRDDNTPPGLTWHALDVTAPKDAAQLPEADHVVYAVSPGRGKGSHISPEQAYERAYERGVAHALRQRGQGKFVLVSSTGVYAERDGSWVDEQTDPKTEAPAQRKILLGEAMVREQASGIVLRLAGIYGPGRTRLVRSVADGTASRSEVWTNRIHRDDCAGAIAHLLTAQPAHDLYLGVDEEPAPMHQVQAWMAERLGVSPPTRPAPRTPRSNKRCSSARLQRSGYRFRYPTYREGYEPILRGFKHP